MEENDEIIRIDVDEVFDVEPLYGKKRFTEFLIKKSGIWEFHKYDKDPFPSLPHGHNKEKKQKLDIYSGIIYDINTKKPLNKINKRKLEEMQSLLIKKGFELNL